MGGKGGDPVENEENYTSPDFCEFNVAPLVFCTFRLPFSHSFTTSERRYPLLLGGERFHDLCKLYITVSDHAIFSVS